MNRIIIFLIIWTGFSCLGTRAQSIYIPTLEHPRNTAVRNLIDERKFGWRGLGAEALTQAREVKRMDSTYYMPWMIEGIYLKEHAADFIGFKNATAVLQKAHQLIQKDYKKQLRTRT